ncbi:PLP-dependent transferase [Violaceomyces palustris]|uniref:PLP-dependent transferase n=1 Tax=Violaceomyces palustris TaxID=1673888 RepID=A0ACD0P8D3_9BASI|nr:PLP-dependent transferase [Violaceomyces palustris]
MAIKEPTLAAKLQKLSDELKRTKAPELGHGCRKLYGFDEDYHPLNNGSFGACPNYVLEAYKHFLDESERRPDSFFRRDYRPPLNRARKEVADLIHCDLDDLVLIPNATTGVNAVMRGLNGTWQKGDAILIYQTIYGACGKTAQYIIDTNPIYQLKLVRVELAYPLSHADFLAKTEEALQAAQNRGVRVRVAILDAISSLPGVIVPWQECVQLLRKHEVLSLVDAAHAIGQIKIDLKKADPDFFTSNCHKWLSCHRGCALLYVPKRNQHLALGIPTSHDYESPNLPKSKGPILLPSDAPSMFIKMWEWTGTQDLSSHLSIPYAIEFRKWLGGEDKIIEYNSNLARKGAAIVKELLGQESTIMDVVDPLDDSPEAKSQRLTACMSNVSIPLNGSLQGQVLEPHTLAHVGAELQTTLSESFDTFVPFYQHDGKVWIRISGQVWLEESDFQWLGERLKEVLASKGYA